MNAARGPETSIEGSAPAAAANKEAVRAFWNDAACGEVYAAGHRGRTMFEGQATARYELEPFIFDFANFPSAAGKDVLEIGVGMGADHLEWAKAGPRTLRGIDLSQRAADLAAERLELYGFASSIQVADAERLPFDDASFDIVYSWGVLHHSPDTRTAVNEVHRVLRPGGRALVMVYQRHSIIGWLLWMRYALMAGRPFRPLADVYSKHLESPGTKAFSVEEVREMFHAFTGVETFVHLSGGDLMLGAAGQRHAGPLLTVARSVWPRGMVRRMLPHRGLFLLIEATR